MEIKNLHFSFDSNDRARPAKKIFENLSLDILPGQISVLLGPSGSGKSTLLRIFAGLQGSPDQSLYTTKKILTESFVFQEATLLNWLSSYKNIMLPIRLNNRDLDKNDFEQVIQILKIKDVLHLYPHQLSGGQKMRVSIARALITRPQILFMDEPFAALDEPTRFKLQDELLQIQSQLKMTILFVTHSFYEAVYLADRIIVLSESLPTKIIYDQIQEKKFLTRFDSTYHDKVKEISTIFSKGLDREK